MQLGALVASGHSPDAILDWTWDQIRVCATAVRQYHTDLAASLWTGKSPTVTEARKWQSQQAARELHESILAQRPDVSAVDAAILVKEELELRKLAAGGIPIKKSHKASPDLFKLAARLKRGESGEPV